MIKIIDNMYDDEMIHTFYEVSKHIFMPPSSFYLSFDDFKNDDGYYYFSTCLPAAFTKFVLNHIDNLLSFFPFDINLINGFEIWVGISGNDSKSMGYLHKDNDEVLRANGKLRLPLTSSILYMTPANKLINGGGTFFQKMEAELPLTDFTHYSSEYLAANKDIMLIDSLPGRLVQFDGKISHAVEHFKIGNKIFPRVNLLVNTWAHEIVSKHISLSTYDYTVNENTVAAIYH